MKKKIMLTRRCGADEKLFSERYDLVTDPEKAEFFVCGASVPPFLLNKLDRTILFQCEPPLTPHRVWCYDNFDKFHTVFCFNPNGKNQFPFADNTLYYPRPAGEKNDIIREDTTITNRGIYYAGMNIGGSYQDGKDKFGVITIKRLRDQIASRLLKEYPHTTVMGEGWENKSKIILQEKDGEFKKNWRLQKIDDLNNCNADFHLCMENCIMKDYVSEKIHDGFTTDRVVLYLGDPDIENKIPKECFINLSPLLNKETLEFDFDKLIEIITNMTQEEYDKILTNARKWRKTITRGDYFDRYDKLNQVIIDRIESKMKFVEYYNENYRERHRNERKEGFENIFKLLDDKKSFIVETGTARTEGNWRMDGQSTVMFDKYIEVNGGKFISIDISPKNIETAKKSMGNKADTIFVCGESIKVLKNFANDPSFPKIDLLYLDSMTVDFNNIAPSATHHLNELKAIMSKLKKGTIIVIDDNDKHFKGEGGKGTYVKGFLEEMGAKKVFGGYQLGYML